MNRRRGIAVLALLALGAGASLWFGIGHRAARESTTSEAPPPHLAAPAPGQVAAKAPDGPKLGGRGGKPAPAAVEEVATGTLVVHVKSKEGGPIAGARVVVLQDDVEHVTETSAEGVARLVGLSGNVSAFVSAEKFAAQDAPDAEIQAGSEANVDVELPPGVPFDGTVVEWPNGKAIPDAEVVVRDAGPIAAGAERKGYAPYAVTRSGADGRFHVGGVMEDRAAEIEVKAAGHVEGGLQIRVVRGSVTPSPVVVQLERAARLVGTVRGPDGAGVAGASVYVMTTAGKDDLKYNIESDFEVGFHRGDGMIHQGAYRGWSSQDGAYVVDGIAPEDEYVAMAVSPHFGHSILASDIRFPPPGLEAHQDLVVTALASLVVRVVDPDGAPVTEDAWVSMDQRPDLAAQSEKAEQDDQAKNVFRFPYLSPGERHVEASASRSTLLPGTALVHLDAGKTAEVVVHLAAGATLEGQLVDEAGNPMRSVEFGIESEFSYSSGGEKSDSEGRFTLRGLSPGLREIGARRIAPDTGECFGTLHTVSVQVPAKGVRLVLARLGTATLRVRTPDGKPYTGKLWAPAEAQAVGHADVDVEEADDGFVRWSGLKAPEYRITVRVDGYLEVARTLKSRIPGDVDLGEVTLQRGALVKVFVHDFAGEPADYERLRADPVLAPERQPGATADEEPRTEQGRSFEWRLPAGKWRISWERYDDDGGPSLTPLGEWTFVEGETRNLELTLPAK